MKKKKRRSPEEEEIIGALRREVKSLKETMWNLKCQVKRQKTSSDTGGAGFGDRGDVGNQNGHTTVRSSSPGKRPRPPRKDKRVSVASVEENPSSVMRELKHLRAKNCIHRGEIERLRSNLAEVEDKFRWKDVEQKEEVKRIRGEHARAAQAQQRPSGQPVEVGADQKDQRRGDKGAESGLSASPASPRRKSRKGDAWSSPVTGGSMSLCLQRLSLHMDKALLQDRGSILKEGRLSSSGTGVTDRLSCVSEAEQAFLDKIKVAFFDAVKSFKRSHDNKRDHLDSEVLSLRSELQEIITDKEAMEAELNKQKNEKTALRIQVKWLRERDRERDLRERGLRSAASKLESDLGLLRLVLAEKERMEEENDKTIIVMQNVLADVMARNESAKEAESGKSKARLDPIHKQRDTLKENTNIDRRELSPEREETINQSRGRLFFCSASMNGQGQYDAHQRVPRGKQPSHSERGSQAANVWSHERHTLRSTGSLLKVATIESATISADGSEEENNLATGNHSDGGAIAATSQSVSGSTKDLDTNFEAHTSDIPHISLVNEGAFGCRRSRYNENHPRLDDDQYSHIVTNTRSILLQECEEHIHPSDPAVASTGYISDDENDDDDTNEENKLGSENGVYMLENMLQENVYRF